ncbi:MAG: transposase [Kiritimatiellae bacterium]|nr:transposase [Kiritimatiellia bacterium]
MNPPPQRRKLAHDIPSWVSQGSRHFITINCKDRHGTPLLNTDIANQLLKSARYYEEAGSWYLWLMLVMPDHVHFITTFDLSRGVRPIVSMWKRYQTRTLKVAWQSDFFEHRLRNDEEFRLKAHYIRMNPVRKDLVSLPEEWPHCIDRTVLDGPSSGDA